MHPNLMGIWLNFVEVMEIHDTKKLGFMKQNWRNVMPCCWQKK